MLRPDPDLDMYGAPSPDKPLLRDGANLGMETKIRVRPRDLMSGVLLGPIRE